MQISRASTLLALALVLPASAAMAGTVGALTAFTSGTPAKAAEVNANFNALKTAVNGNAGDIATLQTTTTTNTSDIAALQTSVGTNSTDIATLQTAYASLVATVTSLQASVSALQAAVPTTTFAHGTGAAPQMTDYTARFVGVTTNVSMQAGERVVVTAHFIPGWVASAAGAYTNFTYSICLRTSGSGAAPSAYGAFMTGTVLDHSGVGYSTASVITVTNPGTYEVGMCGYGSPVIAGSWSSQGSRVVAEVLH